MSHRLMTMKAVTAAMAVAAVVSGPALSGPAQAKDLIIVDGPVKAKDLDCRRCVKRRALRENAVSTEKIRDAAVTKEKIRDGAVGTGEIQDGAVTADKLDPALLEALAPSSSTFYITLDGDGATETIATHGPLTYFARCLVDRSEYYGYQASSEYRASFDRVEIVATSSQSGWFEEDTTDEGGSRPLEEGEEVVTNSRTAYPSGDVVYGNLSETSIVAPDGSYLALEGDAGGMALNIFGHDCLVVGTIYRITGAP